MSNCILKTIFHIKLLKTGFVANDKWRQAPGFIMLHHKYQPCQGSNIKQNNHVRGQISNIKIASF